MSQAQRSDSDHLAEFGYKQELHRTLGSFSSFAAGFSYISILTGMFQTSYLGFLFAGPAFIWAWIFVLFGQMMVALQFAELSAHYPLAGSVYQWSKQVASKAWAWNTGWMYLCAQIVTVPAVALGWQVILPQISDRFVFVGTPADSLDYTNANFAKNAIILGIVMISLTTLINMAGVSVLSRINNIGVAAELVGAAGLILLFLFHANRGPGTVLTDTAGTGAGHDWGYLGALLIGAIMPLYVMYGFDTAGSLAEETDDPQRRAPRAVLQALATAGTMGFLLILFGAMAISDGGYADITNAGGLAGITTDVLGSTWGKVFLADVALAIFVCCLAIHAMSVRILFAMGRDNNLPFARSLASVSGTRRVPVVPAVFVGILGVAILAFNWLNPYAFTIVISCGIVFMYLAYLGVTIPLLQRRLQGWPEGLPTADRGLFKLGGLGILSNGIAILYGAAMTVNLAWPRVDFYGSKWYQEYGVMTAIAVVVLSGLALYYGYQRERSGVLDEHRAPENLTALMNEPPPIHGGP
jgi:urea carboxylase system permease